MERGRATTARYLGHTPNGDAIVADDGVTRIPEAALQDTDAITVANISSVPAPTGLTEIDGTNNADSGPDQVGMFVDGFESVEPD